jgi:hypothetical protein
VLLRAYACKSAYQIVRYFCPILATIKNFSQILLKLQHIKFHENPFHCSQVVTRGVTDRRTDWLPGWLAGWLAGCLTDWLTRRMAEKNGDINKCHCEAIRCRLAKNWRTFYYSPPHIFRVINAALQPLDDTWVSQSRLDKYPSTLILRFTYLETDHDK